MHLQTRHAISGHKMGMLIHSPPKTIHKQLPILKKSSHLSGFFFSKIWNPYGPIESHSLASFPEVSISRLRTASKIENITAMKNRSLPVIRCCAELTREIRFCLPNLMFPHGPHDELAECPNQSAGSQIRTDLKPSEPWNCNVFSHANVANSGNDLPAAIRSYPRLKYGWIFRVFPNLGDP